MKLSTALTALTAGLAVTNNALPGAPATPGATSSGTTPPDALSVRPAATGPVAGRNAAIGAVSVNAPVAPAVDEAPNPDCVPGWERHVATGAAIATPLAGMAGGLLGMNVGAKFDRWISSPGRKGEAIFGTLGATYAVAQVAGLSIRSLVDAEFQGVCQPDCTSAAGEKLTQAFLLGGEIATSIAGAALGAKLGDALTRTGSARASNMAILGGAITGAGLGLAAPLVPAAQRYRKIDDECPA